MQEYKRIDISKDQVVPVAERMRKEGRYLVMIHGFINNDGQMDVSYDYAVDPAIESYHVVGETVLPSHFCNLTVQPVVFFIFFS